MRGLVVAIVILGAACGHNEAQGDPQPSRPANDFAREQARFDADRLPETVVAALAIGPGSRVADIGAGSGLLTVHLARAVRPNGRVVATDIDGAVLDLLQSRLAAAGLADLVDRKEVVAERPGLEIGRAHV